MNRRSFFGWLTALVVTRIPEVKGDGVALQSIAHQNVSGHVYAAHSRYCGGCGIAEEDAVELNAHDCEATKRGSCSFCYHNGQAFNCFDCAKLRMAMSQYYYWSESEHRWIGA